PTISSISLPKAATRMHFPGPWPGCAITTNTRAPSHHIPAARARPSNPKPTRSAPMAIAKQKITPCLWFDTEAEDAAKFYCSIFENSKIDQISRYVDAGQEIHGKKAGSVMVVAFRLEGQKFVALNGGPQFKFDEAISFQISCQTQKEVDYFWSKLTAGGGAEGPCGWLKGRFGLSWQVVPNQLIEMMLDKDAKKVACVTKAFLRMKKFDIEALKRAYDGRQ